jgi:2-keto-3-deoxy-L-rhamnonate aldolase RhmA
VPIAGNLEITIGSNAPAAATSGQAFFMTRGTPHGFRNVGATPAALFEIFIKQTTAAAGLESAETLRALLAAFDLRTTVDRLDSVLDQPGNDSLTLPADAVPLLR